MPHIIILQEAKVRTAQLYDLSVLIDDGKPYPPEQQSAVEALEARADTIADSLEPMFTDMDELATDMEAFLGI